MAAAFISSMELRVQQGSAKGNLESRFGGPTTSGALSVCFLASRQLRRRTRGRPAALAATSFAVLTFRRR
jgi:hypothetical protein